MEKFQKEKIVRAIRHWIVLRKIPRRYKYTPEEKKKLKEWNKRMERQYQWDSQFHDFSTPKEWEKDFHAAMEEGLRRRRRKEKRKKMVLGTVVCCVVVLMVVGISHGEAITEDLKNVFRNELSENGSEHKYFYPDGDLIFSAEGKQIKFVCEGKTLADVYAQIKQKLKRPIFQITNELGEYKIIDAYYEDALELLIINLETTEGKICLSEEQRMDAGEAYAGYEDGDLIVWNKNLRQKISISKGIQDDSYTFFVQNNGAIFNFFGYVSYETCCDIAENIILL